MEKFQLKRLMAIGFFALVASASGKVIEAPTMREALATVDSDTLVIFDLDNTVIMPAQTLGGEEWYDYLVKKYTTEAVKKGEQEAAAKTKAMERAIVEWNAVQKVTDAVAVEKDAPALIQEKQLSGAKTLGLTARPPELAATTQRQLASVGIDFDRAAPSKKKIKLQSKYPAHYEAGVIYVGPGNKKGDLLVGFLKTTKLMPKKIVFVDNKRHHVEGVEEALKSAPIDYLGCRHGAADKKIASFNSDVAELQFKVFNSILSDAAAGAILRAGLH